MKTVHTVALALCAALAVSVAEADSVKLKLIPTGGMQRMGGYMPSA